MKAVNVDEVLKILHRYGKYIFVTDKKRYTDMVDEIANLKALEQEPCEDTISRQAVLNAIMANCIWENEYNLTSSRIKKAVEGLPPVKPQPKTGHWEWVQYDFNPNIGNWHCSECRIIVEGAPMYKYCPNCGAKMESEEEK